MSRKLIALLILAVSLQLGCHGSEKNHSATPGAVAAPVVVVPPQKPWPDPERFAKEIGAFETADAAQAPPEGAIVAIGSSSMRGWHKSIHQDLAPLTVIARGFGGSCMNDAFYYTDRLVLKYKPRAVVLYEGDNDIAGGYGGDAFVGKVKEFAARIHAAQPETRLYVLAVKPSPSRWKHWPEMQHANEALKAYCATDKRLTFIDVATPMLKPDGTPKDGIYLNDNLHMKPEGYAIWTEAVRPALMKNEAKYEKK